MSNPIPGAQACGAVVRRLAALDVTTMHPTSRAKLQAALESKLAEIEAWGAA